MGTINFDINFWTTLFLVLNFFLSLFVSISNRSKAAGADLEAVKASFNNEIKNVNIQLSAHGQRLSHIESEVENGITESHITAVHKRIDKILDCMGPLTGQLAEVSKSVDRLHTELLHLLREKQ